MLKNRQDKCSCLDTLQIFEKEGKGGECNKTPGVIRKRVQQKMQPRNEEEGHARPAHRIFRIKGSKADVGSNSGHTTNLLR